MLEPARHRRCLSALCHRQCCADQGAFLCGMWRLRVSNCAHQCTGCCMEKWMYIHFIKAQGATAPRACSYHGHRAGVFKHKGCHASQTFLAGACWSDGLERAPAVTRMAVPLFALMSRSIGGARIGAAAGACAASARGRHRSVCSAAAVGKWVTAACPVAQQEPLVVPRHPQGTITACFSSAYMHAWQLFA